MIATMPAMKWDGSDKLAAELASRPRGAARRLAEALGLDSQSNISRWCRGAEPDSPTKALIEDALGMPRGWLSSPASDESVERLRVRVADLDQQVQDQAALIADLAAAVKRLQRPPRQSAGGSR